MITIKLPYENDDTFGSFVEKLQTQQSIVIRSSYKKMKDGWKDNDVKNYVKTLNNIELLDSWLLDSAIKETRTVVSHDKENLIFGGKSNFYKRLNNKISKEEYKKNRLLKFVCIGQKDFKGNRKFKLDILNQQIIFKYKLKNHFTLKLKGISKNYKTQLLELQERCERNEDLFSIKLDKNFIFITFEPQQKIVKTKRNRVLSIDMNPREIGYSILEFDKHDKFKVIDSGIVDNSKLLECSTNKKHYETYEISKFLIDKAKHFQCSKFVLEDLTIQVKNHNKGKNFNRLINNNWNRSKLEVNLKKRCEIYGIEFVKVNSVYSSFIGNVIHGEKYPDPICSAIEIGRRGYKKFVKDWFYPKLITIDRLSNLWKKEINESYKSWVELFNIIKKMELRYHFSWKNSRDRFRVFSLNNIKSRVNLVTLCNFILYEYHNSNKLSRFVGYEK